VGNQSKKDERQYGRTAKALGKAARIGIPVIAAQLGVGTGHEIAGDVIAGTADGESIGGKVDYFVKNKVQDLVDKSEAARADRKDKAEHRERLEKQFRSPKPAPRDSQGRLIFDELHNPIRYPDSGVSQEGKKHKKHKKGKKGK
jgi:hypothetical protein